eukprot:c25858_g2_i1 orf=390-1004(-)
MAGTTANNTGAAFCSHCEREVPASNFDLHFAHCKRNLERCNLCRAMVAKACADEHYNDVHAPVLCPLCGDPVERNLLASHELNKCPQRMLACGYCEFPIHAIDLDMHMDHCGNRTEMCTQCGKYVRLQEKLAHNLQYHDGNQEESEPSSRDIPSWADHHLPSAMQPHRPPEHIHTTSKQRLFATFAITGIAIGIGTFLLQRRGG